ncbi:MAG: putative addiction module antidote protein [Cardiobacteriaceae bacterium]|nr:putative addiction module antidote protein [Cardiobacteriaceae bacterium]
MKTRPFDASYYLKDEADIAAYLQAILEENNAQLLVAALGDIAKARGMMQIAKAAGVSRESLYKSLAADAKPRFETIMKVVDALGLQIAIHPKPSDKAKQTKESRQIEHA